MSFRIALAVATGASSGNVTSENSSDYYCTDESSWKLGDTTRHDCFAAIGLLFRSEVVQHGNKDFQFLSARATQRSVDSMRTPRKYTVGECIGSSQSGCALGWPLTKEGKCTIAIVMVNVFPQGYLPGAEKRTYPSRDVASFLELYTLSNQIYHYCMVNKAQPGWAPAGKQFQQAIIVPINVKERK